MRRFTAVSIFRDAPTRIFSSLLLVAVAAAVSFAPLSPMQLASSHLILFVTLIGSYHFLRARHQQQITTVIRVTEAPTRPARAASAQVVAELGEALQQQSQAIAELTAELHSASRRMATIFLTDEILKHHVAHATILQFTTNWDSFLESHQTEITRLRASVLEASYRHMTVFEDDMVVGSLLEQTFEDLGVPVRRLPTPPYVIAEARAYREHFQLLTFVSFTASEHRLSKNFIPVIALAEQRDFLREVFSPLSRDFAEQASRFVDVIVRIGLARYRKDERLQELVDSLPAA